MLVFADSDHAGASTPIASCQRYHDLVTPGSWFVMEDTDGPAADGWRRRNSSAEYPDFDVDPQCEKFYMTFNPGGYLRRAAHSVQLGGRPT